MRASAYPEMLDQGQQWTVVEETTRPHIEFKGRTMSVPLDANNRDRFVRLHEMAHVKWTPRNKPASKVAARLKVPEVFVQCAEDARMAFMLRLASKTGHNVGRTAIYDALNSGGLTPSRVKAFAESVLAQARVGSEQALSMAATALLATMDTGDRHQLKEALWNIRCKCINNNEPTHVVENLDYIRNTADDVSYQVWYDAFSRCRRARPPRFSVTEKLAKALADAIGAKAPSSWAAKGKTIDADGNLVDSGELVDNTLAKMSSGAKKRGDSKEASWGTMNTKKLRTQKPLKGAASRKRVASLSGIVPRRIDRWVTDKRIFDASRRCMGGTVLLDASGSMSIDHADVAALAAASPNMVVAMYSGFRFNGTLTIIAEKGRAASLRDLQEQRDSVGYCNIVDGPALTWLAKQRGPRMWVSDAEVFGSDDKTSPALRQEVSSICKKAQILRLPDIPAALETFKELKKSKGKLTPAVIATYNSTINQ